MTETNKMIWKLNFQINDFQNNSSESRIFFTSINSKLEFRNLKKKEINERENIIPDTILIMKYDKDLPLCIINFNNFVINAAIYVQSKFQR